MVAAGVVAKLASDIGFINGLEDQVKEYLNSTTANIGTSNNGINDLSVAEHLDGMALIFIISGCVLFILSFCGCCGALCNNKTSMTIVSILFTKIDWFSVYYLLGSVRYNIEMTQCESDTRIL